MRVIRRLRSIGPHPILLARYTWHQIAERAHQRYVAARYPALVATPPAGARLRLVPVDIPRIDALPSELVTPAERLRVEADAILEHKVDYLGSGWVGLGEDIDWHRDFKSGYRWDAAFYQALVVTRLDDASDAKVPWELSRGHQLLTLARAWRLFGDERYATELERQLGSWLDANPPGYGINWANPMEVAIRAVNWIWALATLDRALEPSLEQRVVRSLQSHGRHIARNLEGTPFLRSNHYLADITGLVVLGATIEGDPASRHWLEFAHEALEHEITTQVHDDGLGFEASLSYHALALEMFLVARIVTHRAENPFSARYDDRLNRMRVATLAVRHPDGRLPQIGDADSGRILPGGFDRPPTADHLLWLAAATMGDERPLAGPPHAEVAWTLGVDRWLRADRLNATSAAGPSSFPYGGIYLMRSDPFHVVVRCGGVGQNGNGGHAHNDALSFELSCGPTFVVDSGTYVYTSEPEERNAFRGTAAHNTVMVDGHEINPIASSELFSLRPWASPQVSEFVELGSEVRVVGSHDGYRQLEPPVEHRRTFTLKPHEGALVVADELNGSGRQRADSFLHLAAGTDVSVLEDGVYALDRSGVRLILSFDRVDEVRVRQGWVSDRFGDRIAAPVVEMSIEASLPVRFGFRLVTQGRTTS